MVVARELTKLHEEVWRGTLDRAAEEFAARRSGARWWWSWPERTAPPADEAVVVAALRRQVDGGASWRDAAGRWRPNWGCRAGGSTTTPWPCAVRLRT